MKQLCMNVKLKGSAGIPLGVDGLGSLLIMSVFTIFLATGRR